MTTPLITVVTATRTGRYVCDCIRAVAQQTYPHVEHLILIDSNEELLTEARTWKTINPRLNIQLIDDVPDDMFVNARIGALYNRGFDLANGMYIARVDDDNTVEPTHLSALYDTLRAGAYDACYSWRYLWHRNGQPYIEPVFPWHVADDPGRARLLYRVWCEAGIVTPNSNMYKDNLTATYNGWIFPTVDANEWLWHRDVLTRVRYKVDLTYFELLYGYSDDDMFSVLFRDAGYHAGCSRRPTLHYFLGGHSNWIGGPYMEVVEEQCER